ncbi:MAG: alpha/beta hydrolase [Verrucomicrobia bacterium]|nr:alpha/beta hydrolase [Cytophagales bacterium]
MKKIISRFSLVFFVWILFLIFLDGCVQFRSSTPEFEKYFQSQRVSAKIATYQVLDREIRYVATGDTNTEATILFIHGAPSSTSYFKTYLTDSILLSKACLLAVDRPGYGYSGFGKPEKSIEKQVKMILPILNSSNKIKRPVILVGTSYGTSIACRMAMDNPDLIDGLVLVAPALAPGEEKIYPISYPFDLPPLRWMVPRMLLSANAEKLSHRAELTKMLPLWKNIKAPVIYLQGEKDELVYTTNADFARKKMVNVPSLEIIMIADKGHLIAFSEKETIMRAIYRMLDLSKKNHLVSHR